MRDVKENIILYAREIFFSSGFHKTPMDLISSGLQISKKTLYKYFPSKEYLLEEIINRELANALGTVKKLVDSKKNVVEKIIAIFEYYMNRITKLSNQWLKDLRTHTPKLWEKVHSFEICNIYSRLKSLIEQGKRENLINKNLSSDLIIQASIAITHSLIVPSMNIQQEYSLKELIKFIFEFQLNGILNDNGRKIYNKVLKSHNLKTKSKPVKNKNKRVKNV